MHRREPKYVWLDKALPRAQARRALGDHQARRGCDHTKVDLQPRAATPPTRGCLSRAPPHNGRMHRAIVPLLTVIGLCACGPAPPTIPDAAPADAGSDAARDAGLDLGFDAGVDAGPLECAAEPGDGLEVVPAQFVPDGAVDVPYEALRDMLSSVTCETIATCGCSAAAVADCQARAAAGANWVREIGLGTPELADALAAGLVHYDAAAAGRFVAMFRAAMVTCEVAYPNGLTWSFVAARVLRGPGAAEAPCGISYDCGAGLECLGFDFFYQCQPTGLAGCDALGLCEWSGSWGQSHLICAGATCDHGVPPGATPPATRHCRWSTRVDGTCACEPAVGGPCGPSGTCGSGYCASGACAPRTRAIGQSCTEWEECAHGVCLDGLCAPSLCIAIW